MLVSARSHAQPAFALGHPLPAQDLAPGTVSVRVIAGSPSSPVTGTDVTLVVNGTPRQARTDSAGRAFFKDLPADAKVQAKIEDEDKKEVSSDEFPLPADSGVKLMLSTRPMAAGMPGGGGAPFAGGGAGGMPEPRQLSGQPRPEQNDPAGTFTVRLTYDDLKEKTPPADVPVVLVGYASDDSISVVTRTTGPDGRAEFAGLDRSGHTSYFVMTEMPRHGSFDRLLAQPVVMPPQVGVRLLLSSLKADDTAPAIDDMAAPGEMPTPAGKVRVTLEGVPEKGAEIQLVDAATHTVIGKAAQTPGPPDPQAISGGAPFENQADLPAGTLAVEAKGGAGNALDPLAHVEIRVIPADAQEPPPGAPSAETDAAGSAKLEGIAAGKHKAVMTINGKDFVTSTFDLSNQGGIFHVTAQWESTGKPEALIDYIPRAGQVVYAETMMRGQLYRSRPFEGVGDRGAHVVLQIYPRVLFSFSLTSHVEDQYLQVQGRFELFNNSWAPYAGPNDGIVIPLPKGFKGGVLAEQDQTDVAVVPTEGFKLGRPIPPGGKRFIGGFSLPVENGKVEWKLDLPYGAYQSGIEIMQFPGMNVELPKGVRGENDRDERGSWYVLPQITILPNQSMVMAITGLPSAPAWSVWVPRLVGILVVVVMLAGLAVALLRRRAAPEPDSAGRAARRQRLLDELVALEKEEERTPKQDRRREAVLAELEQLWDEN
ncbi:MAG: hypothetical protein ACM31C_25385 [Acidobacteriota bacterium]